MASLVDGFLQLEKNLEVVRDTWDYNSAERLFRNWIVHVESFLEIIHLMTPIPKQKEIWDKVATSARTAGGGAIHSEIENTYVVFRQLMLNIFDQRIPPPHPQMPEDVKHEYIEAKSVFQYSTRSAGALLRLAAERLVRSLVPDDTKDLYKMIGQLVEQGLSTEIQQALDIVRVTGNSFVHAGQLVDDDDIVTVKELFRLLNTIVDDQIAKKGRIAQLYAELPEEKRRGIEDRDKR
jgi:hypothetical protein